MKILSRFSTRPWAIIAIVMALAAMAYTSPTAIQAPTAVSPTPRGRIRRTGMAEILALPETTQPKQLNPQPTPV